jgi:sucrose phosphorylase
MVYQFSLPPLLLNTLFTGNSKYLTQWAMTIPDMPADNTFFNFTASHDGIGVRPLEGLVAKEDFNRLIDGIKSFGAKINTKRNSDGTDSPYEINVTYYDAMKGIHSGLDNLQTERFICSQAIMMTLKGVPAFYIHSLLGTHNDLDGVKQTGMNRSINRKKWNKNELFRLLNSDTEYKNIFQTLCNLIEIRKSNNSFHPNCDQRIIDAGNSLFCIARNNYNLISVSNITSSEKEVDISLFPFKYKEYTDIILKVKMKVAKPLILRPYQTVWLVP